MSELYERFIERYPIYAQDKLIAKAFDVAEAGHKGQMRKSGEPYITHPYQVAFILADMKFDAATICSGILHDVLEDTETSFEQMREEFGVEIANIVDGVTKLSRIDFKSKEEAQAENFRKMFLAMASDIRVIIVKLADRLHNMRTIEFHTPEKQREKASETLDIYAPLAHRLGIYIFEWEFEDLSLKVLEPAAYEEIKKHLEQFSEEHQDFIDTITGQVSNKVEELGLKADISGRLKKIYSIYRKMQTKHKTIEEIYDLVAIRVIVDSIKDCYAVLGALHAQWRPLPMRFKDYIAVPKENMYQSLHTTLLGKQGIPFEVQIRTHEMHATAEYGIAAHWMYKEDNPKMENKLTWIKELAEWQREMKDSKEFMETVKVNFFSDNVFVFTPKGDVKDFVKGSTPLDFAYSIHSAIGNQCVGARVNGRLVPLNYELKTGDIVEILTSASHKGPSRDWINMVKTASARSKIRSWFRKELKEDNIHKGREMLEKEAKRAGYDLYELTQPDWLKPIFKRFTLNSLDDMYAAVGYGGLTTGQILTRLIQQQKNLKRFQEKDEMRLEKSKASSAANSVTVKGYTDMVVRFARCCSPIPGDKIVGFITRGRGITVHRAYCTNVQAKGFDKEREIEVTWTNKPEKDMRFFAEIMLSCQDRAGLLVEISQAIYNLGYTISTVNARPVKNGATVINIGLEIGTATELTQLMERLRQIPSVESVYRVNS